MAEFIMVHLAVLHGQAHAAEAEVAVDLRKKRILNHVIMALGAALDELEKTQ